MKVGYSKTFPIIGKEQWEKSWLEDEIPLNIDLVNCTDEDIAKAMLNVRKVQYALKKQVESFHFESNKAAEKLIEHKELNEESKTIAEIFLCTDLVALKTFEVLTKANKAIRTAYIQKSNQLSNKTKVKLP